MKVDGDIEYWEDDCVIQNDITWIDGGKPLPALDSSFS